MKFRFNLKWMLVAVAFAGLILALITQIGMGIAEFEIQENNLRLNEDGLVDGELHLIYEGDESFGMGWPYECKLTNVDVRELVALKPGMKSRVRYRITALGPLEKQEPCACFLSRNLGIDRTDIVGYVSFKTATDVVINGKQ